VERCAEEVCLCPGPSPSQKNNLTPATKSYGVTTTTPFWDERFKAMAKEYPDVRTDQYHIDILTAHLGQPEATAAIVRAIEQVVRHGPRTRDLGGYATMAEVGRAIAEAV
jgi:isocitrate/isopropylmalate dehydrogenase